MSNALAIAAVTATLEAILGQLTLDSSLSDTQFTALPPDKARGTITSNQLNLFLYQVVPNAAWRNMDVARQVKPGETGMSPLALDLRYLMTVFGRENDSSQPFDHHLLGKAMSILYDHALLGPDEIKLALPGSGLEQQVDRVRITWQPLSLEDISKLWTGFATQYRLSVGYDVSVVLIDSTQPVKAPLPVLTRGAQDQGPSAQGSLVPPFPELDSVQPPNNQLSVRLGEILTVTGHDLDGANLGVIFNNPLWTSAVEVAPQAGGTSTQLTVQIPNQPAAWPAGFYTLQVAVQRPGETYRRMTNELSFSLAPTITITPQSAAAGNITFTVKTSPEVWPGQTTALLLGEQNIPGATLTSQTSTLSFSATLAKGAYYVRLRVEGVDSVLVNRSVSPPVFDSTQKVTAT